MELYTSFYSNRKIRDLTNRKIATSIFPPKWFKADLTLKELAPSKELLLDYKNRKVDKIDYINIYFDKIKDIDLVKDLKDGDILLCFEKIGDFCHRHLLANELRKLGIVVKEYGEFKRLLVDDGTDIVLVEKEREKSQLPIIISTYKKVKSKWLIYCLNNHIIFEPIFTELQKSKMIDIDLRHQATA